jgi:hypothetical protein
VLGCLLFIGSVNNNKEDLLIVWTIFQYIELFFYFYKDSIGRRESNTILYISFIAICSPATLALKRLYELEYINW